MSKIKIEITRFDMRNLPKLYLKQIINSKKYSLETKQYAREKLNKED